MLNNGYLELVMVAPTFKGMHMLDCLQGFEKFCVNVLKLIHECAQVQRNFCYILISLPSSVTLLEGIACITLFIHTLALLRCGLENHILNAYQ